MKYETEYAGEPKHIAVLGASFDTGNLGVSALAWSTIKLIVERWPEAEICVVGSGRRPGIYTFHHDEQTREIALWPVRYAAGIFIRNHIVRLWLGVVLSRLIPGLRVRLAQGASTRAAILRADRFFDVTGGDSFSDIYGMWRLFRAVLLKRVCEMTTRPFVLLPQTYGPFSGRTSRSMARSVLRRAAAVYARDEESLHHVEELCRHRPLDPPPRVVPDVAFIMDTHRRESEQVRMIEARGATRVLVGLNVSGLLYRGGYRGNNMFGLACDYSALVRAVAAEFASREDHHLVLVPHVMAQHMPVEDDGTASLDVFESLDPAARRRVSVLLDHYDQNEVKYVIGLCTFFLGSRMHSTVAALSQNVPAVGLAYSRKFTGVFRTAGVESCVVDLRTVTVHEALTRIDELYTRRDEVRQHLALTMPEVRSRVLSLFGASPHAGFPPVPPANGGHSDVRPRT